MHIKQKHRNVYFNGINYDCISHIVISGKVSERIKITCDNPLMAKMLESVNTKEKQFKNYMRFIANVESYDPNDWFYQFCED